MLLPRTRLATKQTQAGSRPRYEKPSNVSRGSVGSRTNGGKFGMTICLSDLLLAPKLEHARGPMSAGWLMLDHVSHTFDVVLQLSEVSTNVP